MTVSLDAARPLDAGAVGAILSRATDDAPWLPRVHSRAQEIRFAADMIDAGWVQVARRNGAIAGFLSRNGADIHGLYLDPSVQRQGLGRAFVQAAQAVEPALRLWVYQANMNAQAFYRALGFCETQRTDGSGNDAGLPDIRFEWQREAG
ncbi:hypothetical protein SuNHUV7_24110 (plasmid) [Pseudoseohaeicola sp. NH-UV-7]|uniref:GNAT family N-acetyltransferase n=1 Tax=unclassified Sulfitobacter TaxID=196795 RepID=UPI000E0ABAEC|nr:GNAT family N-acetyltransferase [Sulfitobacter sp. JL08]AXI55734.1 N-acetyltransferase [Sulfitobacter sp. JL08]